MQASRTQFLAFAATGLVAAVLDAVLDADLRAVVFDAALFGREPLAVPDFRVDREVGFLGIGSFTRSQFSQSIFGGVIHSQSLAAFQLSEERSIVGAARTLLNLTNTVRDNSRTNSRVGERVFEQSLHDTAAVIRRQPLGHLGGINQPPRAGAVNNIIN